MPETTARLATPNGSRYLLQLCKHWSHRFPDTTFDPAAGRVPFANDRTLTLRADPDALTLTLDAPEDQQARMQAVVMEHLRRFAFREELGEGEWTASQK